jgi:hypothetical protein
MERVGNKTNKQIDKDHSDNHGFAFKQKPTPQKTEHKQTKINTKPKPKPKQTQTNPNVPVRLSHGSVVVQRSPVAAHVTGV